jgi:acyl-CoA thioester hydrolase
VKPPSIPVEKVLALESTSFRLTIPESHRDANGHMNMRWYAAIFDGAGVSLYDRLGITPEYHRRHGTGTFDLEHHTHFLREVRPGEQVAVYVRLVGCSAKRFHYLMFMINETRGELAAIFECINSFADLRRRKTIPFPPEIAGRINDWVATDSRRDWSAPVCGAMHA